MAALVFDLDGTLVDLPVPIEAVRAEIEAILARAGVSGPARPILAAIARAAAAGQGDAAAAARAVLDEAEREAAGRAVPRPGAARALALARERGAALGLVTNNGRACVAPALAAVGADASDFAVVTRDDVPRPKPDPAGLVLAARRLGAAAGLVYIGDATADVAAAAAAAAELGRPVAMAAVPGRNSGAELRGAGPCTVFGDLAAAVEWALAARMP